MTGQQINKQLQENTSAFGLMSEEMQAKARDINEEGNFQLWMADKWVERVNRAFSPDYTYRLRPDYKEESEVVKCEVITKNGILGCKYRIGADQYLALSYACSDPDFIGFLYEDGTVASTPRIYQHEKYILGEELYLKYLEDGSGKVLTPTHVLFKETK